MLMLAGGYWLVGDLPAPTPQNLAAVRPSTLILDREGRTLFEAIGDQGKQVSLSFEQIPAACWQATVAVEDSRFFHHPGIDPLAIGRAAVQNWRSGAVISGASTITQQLARNTLMTVEERYEQSLRRKLREAWLALRIELRYDKQEILALYLNQVYYGNFAYGLEGAAQGYFGKSARELDLAECSLLAGLVQNPEVYNPLYNLESAAGGSPMCWRPWCSMATSRAARRSWRWPNACSSPPPPSPSTRPTSSATSRDSWSGCWAPSGSVRAGCG